MEQNAAAVETAGIQEGVNSVPDHEGQQETSPVSENTDEHVEASSEDTQPEIEVPFHKHPRFQKLNKRMKRYQSELQELNQRFESPEVKGALALADMLRENPSAAKTLYGILNGQSPEQALLHAQNDEPQDPYAGYEEGAASKFRELDELKAWKQAQEEKEQVQYQEALGQYQQDLNREFDKRLIADGYLKDDGSAYDETFVDLMGDATMAYLQSNAQNPNAPTPQEFDAAYNVMKQSIQYLEKHISKKAIDKAVKSSQNVPPTGSRGGTIPGQKESRSDMDRVMDIANSL